MSLNRRCALLALAAGVGAARARTAPNVMLAREAPADADPRGWLVSEKFDGVRALWDGRQLRFRSGDTVSAPAWFTAGLPAQALDGELWLDRARFEPLVATVRRARPVDAEWRAVRYLVFDLPAAPGPFGVRAARVQSLVAQQACPWLLGVEQWTIDQPAALQRRLQQVVAAGGEGLMLHRADAPWQAGRSDALLKLKPRHDADAVVTGHVPGQGRHAGRTGALKVRTPDGVDFLLGTGLSDAQRDHPPAVGRVVTFTHRGYTGGGVPRFASFLRLRDD
jgi:DNA ligase-1